MFEIEIRDGLLHIGGYVNAVGRDSKPIFSKKRGRCVEQVTPGAFSSSLADGHEVFMKLNHEKVIATTADGSLELREDNIGLKAQATVSDEEVITMAEKGLLKAWSFGFEAIDDDMEERSGQLPRRHLNRIKLNEVSVLSKSPAYEGTLVELRDGDSCEPEDTDGTADEPAKEEPAKDEPDETAAKLAEIRTFIALEEIGELIRQGEAEYRAYRDREEAQAFIDAAEAQQWIDEQEEEERYNHYHDPTNGQFASGKGGGVGLYYSMGKGKGAIVGESSPWQPKKKREGLFAVSDLKVGDVISYKVFDPESQEEKATEWTKTKVEGIGTWKSKLYQGIIVENIKVGEKTTKITGLIDNGFSRLGRNYGKSYSRYTKVFKNNDIIRVYPNEEGTYHLPSANTEVRDYSEDFL